MLYSLHNLLLLCTWAEVFLKQPLYLHKVEIMYHFYFFLKREIIVRSAYIRPGLRILGFSLCILLFSESKTWTGCCLYSWEMKAISNFPNQDHCFLTQKSPRPVMHISKFREGPLHYPFPLNTMILSEVGNGRPYIL